MITENIDEFCSKINKDCNGEANIIGIDYGLKKTGLAITEHTISISFPLLVIKSDDFLIAKILKIIENNNVKALIIGYPIDKDGNLHQHGKDVVKISEIIKSEIDLPILLLDESYTTVQAKGEFYEMYHSIINSQKIRARKKASQIKKYAILKDSEDDSYAANILLKRFIKYYKDLYPSIESNS